VAAILERQPGQHLQADGAHASLRRSRLFGTGKLEGVAVAILAGGLGTRLRPTIGAHPKVLAPVHNRPFLTYLLDGLVDASVGAVVLLTGYQADEVRLVLGDTYRGLRLEYSREPAPLGTGGAVRWALPRLTSELVLLLNGDSCCELDLAAFRRFHLRKAADISLALAEVPDTARFGQVLLARDRRVIRFGEKAQVSGAGWINAGIYLLKRALIEEIPTGRPTSLEHDMFPAWAKPGTRMFGHRSHGRFIDIGTPASFAAAEAFFMESE
jgi:NDP-sugar pyrophosphorylase family protein